MTTELSRRSVARGAAWAAPALVVGAPAAMSAASGPCSPYTATWNSSTNSTGTSASTTANTGTSGLTLSATTVANGATHLRDTAAPSSGTGNFYSATVNASDRSGAGWLILDQDRDNSAGQTVTMTFSTTVYCVSFYVNDIDTQWVAATNHYRDDVTVAGFTASPGSNATNISVNGGQAYSTANATSKETSADYTWNTSGAGLAVFSNSSTSGLKSITLTYKNTNVGTGTSSGNNQQQVYISPIKYSTSPCNCS